MIHLAKDPNFIQDLGCASGVSRLGTLDSYFSSVLQSASEDLTKTTGAEQGFPGEVSCCFLDFFP